MGKDASPDGEVHTPQARRSGRERTPPSPDHREGYGYSPPAEGKAVSGGGGVGGRKNSPVCLLDDYFLSTTASSCSCRDRSEEEKCLEQEDGDECESEDEDEEEEARGGGGGGEGRARNRSAKRGSQKDPDIMYNMLTPSEVMRAQANFEEYGKNMEAEEAAEEAAQAAAAAAEAAKAKARPESAAEGDAVGASSPAESDAGGATPAARALIPSVAATEVIEVDSGLRELNSELVVSSAGAASSSSVGSSQQGEGGIIWTPEMEIILLLKMAEHRPCFEWNGKRFKSWQDVYRLCRGLSAFEGFCFTAETLEKRYKELSEYASNMEDSAAYPMGAFSVGHGGEASSPVWDGRQSVHPAESEDEVSPLAKGSNGSAHVSKKRRLDDDDGSGDVSGSKNSPVDITE